MKTSSPLKRKLAAGLMCLGVMGSAQPASAQDSLQELVTANSGFIITLVVLTSASTVTYITQGLTDRWLDQLFADTERYMNNNAAALGQDIALGAGDSLSDLAMIYAVPEHERDAFFARAHAQRHILMPLVNKPEVTSADARAFVLAILTPEQIERYR